MSAPDFTDPFNIAYDSLSIHKDWLTIPSWCNTYDPENNDEFECLVVIQPAPEKGAKAWTMNGKRVLIGVFRDQGRKIQQQDIRVVQWARYDTRLVVTTDRPHFMLPGDKVNLWDVNVPVMTTSVVGIQSMFTFEVQTNMVGGQSGVAGGYQPVEPVNFYEDFIVFRLLPSMKVVSWPTVQAILNAGAPIANKPPVHLVDINNGSDRLVAAQINSHATHLLPNGSIVNQLLNRQQINEGGAPIRATYDNLGRLMKTPYRYSKRQDVIKMIDPVTVNEECSCDPQTNDKLYVYDYYGFDLNDDSRAPYNSKKNVVYDSASSNGLKIRPDNTGEAFYRGIIQDEFGNVVIGARPDNTLVTRQAILPLQVDQFNVPYKEPRKEII
jgi:hypothetical protein